jgi:hypothetical protein
MDQDKNEYVGDDVAPKPRGFFNVIVIFSTLQLHASG